MTRILYGGRTRPSTFRDVVQAGACIALMACGSDGATDGTPGTAANSVVFTRADGSRVQFVSGAPLHVWCGPWENGVVPTQSVHVWYGGPAASSPYWYLRAVVADVVPSQPLAFPNSYVWDAPTGADVFLSDPSNGLSTSAEGSSGSLTFDELNCASGGEVRFTVNAAIGSELGGGPSVTATGALRGTVGQSPF